MPRCPRWRWGTYHVEGDDILERDLAGAVALHEDLVDDLGAAAGRKAQDEGVSFGRVESLDAAWVRFVSMSCCWIYGLQCEPADPPVPTH